MHYYCVIMVSLSKERLVIFDIVKHDIEYSSNTCIKKTL